MNGFLFITTRFPPSTHPFVYDSPFCSCEAFVSLSVLCLSPWLCLSVCSAPQSVCLSLYHHFAFIVKGCKLVHICLSQSLCLSVGLSVCFGFIVKGRKLVYIRLSQSLSVSVSPYYSFCEGLRLPVSVCLSVPVDGSCCKVTCSGCLYVCLSVR